MHYFLNIYTKESQWDLPTAPAEPSQLQVNVMIGYLFWELKLLPGYK